MATAIPTLSTGNVLTAAEWNYLTQLNTQVGCFGAGGLLAGGGANPQGIPGFQLQAEVVIITYTHGSGYYAQFFPTAFSNGVISVVGTVWNTTDYLLTGVASQTNLSQWGFALFYNGSEAPTGSYEISYIAFGF